MAGNDVPAAGCPPYIYEIDFPDPSLLTIVPELIFTLQA